MKATASPSLRRTLLVLLPVLAFCARARAADLTLDELQAPSSPAFTLVGISPSKVDRPGSAPAFGASLVNAATESTGGLPRNLAFEFAPYWWQDHPRLTREQFEQAGLGDVIMQSATVSLATYEKEATATEPKYSGIGGGLRFDLIRGSPNPKVVKELKSLLQKMVVADGFGSDPNEEQLKKIQKLATSYDTSRVGHQLAFAAAVAYKFEGNDLDNKTWDRYGAWLTYGYKSAGESRLNQFTFLATARTITAHGATANSRYTDFGGKLLWRDPEHPVAISLEYIKRTGDAHDETFNALLQYKLNETWFIFVSHGNQLEGDADAAKKLTTAGLSFAWGKTPKLKL